MNIVVMGMEMPKDCIVCYETTKCLGTGRCFEDGTIWCGLAKGYIGFKDTSEKCPLVELPEKHGNLIDETPLMKYFLANKYEKFVGGYVAMMLMAAPTIVEAEG